jgi:sirohydrochlorin cobaltochelatase
MSSALVLAGHGSHLNGNSSEPIWANATRLRNIGYFDDVRVGLWKEEPSLSRVLDGCEADAVTVVPLFISAGYFTKTVVPREMGLDGPETRRGRQVIRYTPPVGAHPVLADVVVERALEAGARSADAVVVLGHGTRRDAGSEKNIFGMADLVRARGLFAEVEAVFLDQEPNMLQLLDILSAQVVVVVPLFIAEGWHVGQTIPEDLALDGAETRRAGRVVRYTPPVGTHQSMAGVILKLAREAAR